MLLYLSVYCLIISLDPSLELSSTNITSISLWAIGNKNPEVTLEGEYDYQKYSKNNIFKINKKDMNISNYNLKIKAEIGDVINIGSSSFDINLIRKLKMS